MLLTGLYPNLTCEELVDGGAAWEDEHIDHRRPPGDGLRPRRLSRDRFVDTMSVRHLQGVPGGHRQFHGRERATTTV